MIYARDSSEKKHLLIDVLLSQGVEGQRVLVFVATKREADMLEEFLYHERFPATSIHGDRTQTEREQALKSFRAGREKVLVATDRAVSSASTGKSRLKFSRYRQKTAKSYLFSDALTTLARR